jgi:hypothetical protein
LKIPLPGRANVDNALPLGRFAKSGVTAPQFADAIANGILPNKWNV